MGALSQRSALVTGGSREIGRAIVQRLAGDGVVVAFSHVKDDSATAEVEREVARSGGRARGFAADFSKNGGVREFFDEAEEWLGALHIVVLNAQVHEGGPIAEVTTATYDHIMDGNAKATFFGIQEAARRLSDGGRIITVSPINSRLAEPGDSVFEASKAAIERVSAIAAWELRPRAVTVNVVSPRVTGGDRLNEGTLDPTMATTIERSHLGNGRDSASAADVVAFLVGPDGALITGQTLRASDGVA